MNYLLREEGKQEKALEAIEKAIALDPNQAEFHNHAGVIHFNLGNQEQGITCLQKSLALKPQSLDYSQPLNICNAPGMSSLLEPEMSVLQP